MTTDHMGSILLPITNHIPSFITVAHTELWIFDFLLLANQDRYANEVLNMCIWWGQTTWLVLVPNNTHIPSFTNITHTELWIFDFFVISQSEQICKWGIKYALLVTTDHVGSTCAPQYPHTKFYENRSCVLITEAKGYIWCWRDLTHIHPSVHTYRQRYK